MKKIKWKTLLIAIAIPLAVGGISALLTMGSMQYFDLLEKPPLSPPGWLFPIVWTALFVLMGIASYLIVESDGDTDEKVGALKFYFIQLIFNLLWSVFFFNFEKYSFAFVWLLTLLFLIILTTVRFFRIDKRAALLMIPYILWGVFAAYLNLGIAVLN